MAQHDYNLANQSGADFRADLNNALAAIATVNSGATEPSTTFAHQLWVDTANSLLKIRNAANTDWITFGVSISSSNVFTGNLTGDVTGNLTGNVTGNVTGDLTGNADTATTLATARTISLSGDVAGSASFDGSGDITITTTAQIDSIALGTDTTGDYVQSISGGTGVTITGGTGESSTPVVAIGQAVAVTSDVTFNIVTATNEFIGDLEGGIRFNAKADGALSAGDVVYISGVSGDVPTVAQAKADDASKMPAFGLALSDANDNAALQVVTFGTIENLDTSGVSEGQILYVSTTAGAYTTTAPTGESSQIQNIGKVIRSHASAGSIKVGGAGRSNATPNLDNGKIFIGNGSNQSATSTLDTSIVPENTNLYWTTARGESMFDTRLATKDTGDLAEGSNLYYTTARVNSDFDTRLATKDTDSLSEGVSNLYYTTTRVNSDFDTRLATKDTSDLTEGSNLYYTTARANSDFDTRLATKSTTNLAEGTNLYYTDARFDTRLATKDTDDLTEGTNLYYTQARFDSAFGNKTTNDLTENTNLYYTDARANSAIDTRVTKTFVDALNIQAASVDANSVTLGIDTVGNYIQTITGTANKITVTGSGSESADVTLTLPDDVQIADSLTVAGNLTVNGTLTSLDTTNLDIEDNLFQLNAGLTGSPVNDSGMLINRGNQDNGIFMWDESADKFTLGLTTADGTATGNITLNSLGTLVANIEGNVTGNVTGTVSSLSNHDTADLAEGTNLYYTDARADARVNLQTGANLDLSSKSTSDLSEGTNEYFTTARARSSISASGDLSYNSSTGVISFTASAAPVTSVNTLTGAVVLDSDDIAEGSTNLYYTDARARAAISEGSTQLAYNSTTGVLTYTQGDTDTVSEGSSNLYYTSARFDSAFSGKSTSDLTEGTNLYYTDARFDTRLATKDTDDVSEGASNLYYTDARSRAAVSVSGDLAYNSSTGVFSFTERTDAEVQALITAGTGVTVSSGQVSIGQSVATSASPTFANMTLSGTGSIKVPSGTTAQRDGSPANGMFRYNSEDAQFEGYADGAWGAIAGSGGGASAMETNNFTGDGSTTAFTLSSSVSNEDNLLAFIEGVYQNKADYVASGTTITFDTAPANGRNIVVHHVKSSISGSNVILNSFTGDGSDTAFTLSTAPQSENNTQVHLNGVYQNKSTYTVSGTTLTFDAAPANGVAIEVIMFTQTTINQPAANTVGVTQLDLSDGTNGQVLTTDGAGTLSFSTVSGTTINNNADNRIITGSGTANTLNGESGLTYDGSTLAVTGTATMDGLTVDGGATSPTHVLTGSRAGTLVSIDNQSASTSYGLRLNIASVSANSYPLWVESNDTNRLIVKGNGDISFYDDTGSTQALFWDASAESLGIGTTSPAAKLHIDSTGAALKFTRASQETYLIEHGTSGLYTKLGSTLLTGWTQDHDFKIYNNAGSQYVMFDGSTSRVGIGTTSPAVKLAVNGGTDNVIASFTSTDNGSYIQFTDNNATGHYIGTVGGSLAILNTSNVERMRIDSAGNLLMGTTSTLGASAAGTTHITGGSNSANEAPLYLRNPNSTSGRYWKTGPTNNAGYIVYNNANTGVYITYGNNSWTSGSDESLKENISDVGSVIDKVKDYRCVNYSLKSQNANTADKVGFIAQDWENDFPNVVDKNDEGILGMKYTETIPVLLKAIQEQQTIIESLEARITTLENA